MDLSRHIPTSKFLTNFIQSNNKNIELLNTLNDVSSLSFNILPNRNVYEQINVKKYILKRRSIEAIFDRDYHSDMLHSPDHLIFLSILIQLQKMIYIYLCYEFNYPFSLEEEEKLKIWPTNINIDMPKMITKRTNISHKIEISSLRKINSQTYFGKCNSSIENIINIKADAMVSIVK